LSLAVVSHFSEEKMDPVYKDRHLLGLEQCPEELEELQKRLLYVSEFMDAVAPMIAFA
jgi:hypothetical protein